MESSLNGSHVTFILVICILLVTSHACAKEVKNDPGDINWDDDYLQNCSGNGRCLSRIDSGKLIYETNWRRYIFKVNGCIYRFCAIYKYTECWSVRADKAGIISFTKLSDGKTKSCQTILDISPHTRLRIGLTYNPCSDDTDILKSPYYSVFRVDSENENFPIEHAMKL